MNRAQLHAYLVDRLDPMVLPGSHVVVGPRNAERLASIVVGALEQLPSRYELARVDGDPVGDDYGWFDVDHLDDWQWAIANDHDEDDDPVEYEIRRVITIDSRTRTFPSDEQSGPTLFDAVET